jgi:sugar-specific transcriptional regulator TrmB
MILERQLERLDFSEGEARVYLAALELGETSVARIAQKAGIERTTTYLFLETLKKRGLITLSKSGKKTVYAAQNPKRLKSEVEEKSKFIDTLLPELLSITNAIDKKPKVRFFENKEGIYDIYRETLDFSQQSIRMWMSDPWFDDANFWTDYYLPTRLEKKILMQAIIPRNEKTIPFAQSDNKHLRQTRMTNGDDFKADIMLYGNKHIAIISFHEMHALVLESKQLHDTLLFIFNSHWASLPPNLH